MSIIDLTKDLSNFNWTNYDGVTTNNSQIKGRHGGTKPGGQPPHPTFHSELDNGAGVPQSFYDGHSKVVTGQKEFKRPNPKSLADMESKFGPLNTQPLERGPYGVADYMDGTKQGRGFIPPGGPPLGFTVDQYKSELEIDGKHFEDVLLIVIFKEASHETEIFIERGCNFFIYLSPILYAETEVT